MSRYLSLSVLLAALTATAAANSQPRSEQARGEVSWSDSFTEPQLKGYALVGKLLRDKRGGVILGDKGILIREQALGFEAEAEADIVFPQALGPKRGLLLTIRSGYDINFTLISLRIEKGKPVLELRENPIALYSLDGPGVDPEGPWTLKVHVRYGIVQAKAWPKGKPEPKDWQVTRYSGTSEWEPRVLSVLPDTGEVALLTRLAIHGTKPATNLYLKAGEPDWEQKRQLVRLTKQANGLLSSGNAAGALTLARTNLESSRKLFGPEHAFTAVCLHNLGAVLLASGDHVDALKTLEEALKLRRKVLPRDHPQLAISIEGTGAALVAAGKPAEGEKRHREALALRVRVLGPDHPDTAVSWNNLGEALALQAQHKEALASFRESLRIRKAFYGELHVDVARTLNNLGFQYFMMGEYREAQTHYAAAMKAYKVVHGVNHDTHPETAKLENNLGVLSKAMGRFDKARGHFEKALAIFTKLGGPKARLRGTVLGHMALLYAETGDYVAARTLMKEALDIHKEALGEDHYETAVTRLNYSLVLEALGEPEAKLLVKEAFKKLTTLLPADHPTVAQAMQNVVWLTTEEADASDDVLKTLEAAVAIKRKRLGLDHPDTVITLNILAQKLLFRGEFDRAEKLLLEALAACRDKLGDDHPLSCEVRMTLGVAYMVKGKPDAALAHLHEAAGGFAKAYGKEHPRALLASYMLTLAMIAKGEVKEGFVKAGEAAAGFAKLTRRLLAGTPESQHAALTEQWRPLIRLYLSSAVANAGKLGQQGPALWNTVMDWKATSGRMLLNRLEALVVERTPEAVTQYEELKEKRRDLVRGIMRGAGSEGVEEYNAVLRKLRGDVEDLERQLARVPGYSEVVKAREAGPVAVAGNIPEGGVLIEFVRLDEIKLKIPGLPKELAEASYVALVVVPQGKDKEPAVTVVSLGGTQEVDKTIENWRKLAKSRKRDPVIEEELREKLWDPLAKFLPAGTKHLVIAPAGQLALLPFEAIWSDDAFLVEKYLISYCSSGRDLIPRPAPAGELGPPVVVADPDFDSLPAGEALPPGSPAAGISGLAFRSQPPKEDRLAGFTAEADAVTKLLAAKFPGGAKTLRQDEASEENVLSLKRPRLLYFITHGNFLQDQKTLATLEGRPAAFAPGAIPGDAAFLSASLGEDPRLRSYLCLAGFNKWKERVTRRRAGGKEGASAAMSDGILTAREVETMDLWGTDLVVTAACKTGEGQVQVGEGVMGLRRAFQQAGARTVVTSLWSVSDEKTAILLPRFLEHYLAGVPKAEALRKAQLEMIAELRKAEPKKAGKYQAPPFNWAAFVCHGLPR